MLSIQMTVLASGVATFFALVLWRANPLCTWLEWTGVCCSDDDPVQSEDSHQETHVSQ
jgi:hypothetical protein